MQVGTDGAGHVTDRILDPADGTADTVHNTVNDVLTPGERLGSEASYIADCLVKAGLDGVVNTARLAWECARPNAIVTVVALYDKAQTLPLPDMYGKNLIFKTGGVDGCDCDEVLS